MEEKAREDEKDVEVMAMVVEVSRGAQGGSFYKKSGRERGPFRRRDRRRRGGGAGESGRKRRGRGW